MVQRGNTVQSVTEEGQLQLNLPWQEISEADRATIRASTPSKPITLSLKKKAQLGKGADACHSFFSYVGLKL